MIEINNKAKCCGCRACENICPKQAVKMVYDSEGFLYPQVNKEECVDCSLCDKVCPVLHKADYNEQLKLAYAAKVNDDNARRISTSGGVAYALASYVQSLTFSQVVSQEHLLGG